MKLEEVISKLINKVEASNGEWIKPFNNSMPQNFVSGTYYNGINIFWLWATAEEMGYSSNEWATFKQIKQAGGTVKKGEKSTPVFFFKPLKIKEENENGEQIEKVIPLLKSYLVFNIDQTTLTSKESSNKAILELDEFIAAQNIDIRTFNDSAYYSPSKDYINIPHLNTFISSEFYYGTLLHELAHSTGHESRLNRDFSGRPRGSEEQIKAYAKEELIAETTRVFLQTALGLEDTKMEEQNAIYLKGWLRPLKEDSKMLWQIFSEATKAFNYLMDNANSLEAIEAA